MTQKIAFLLLFFALTMLSLRPAVAATPVAVLLFTTGQVSVQRQDGSSAPTTYGLQLFPGDVISTQSRSQAEIFFENGAWVEIGPRSSMSVESAKYHEPKSQPAMAEKSFQAFQRFLKLKDAQGASSLESLRALSGIVELRAESPCRSKIRNGAPTFRWSAENQQAKCRLAIRNEKGVHWEYTVRGPATVPYPATAPPLVGGVSYSWTVEIIDPLKSPPVKTEPIFFELIGADEEKAIRKALNEMAKERRTSQATYHLVRASLFYEHGLLNDAIEETKRAVRIDVNDTLRAVLSQLLTESGLAEAGQAETSESAN